MLQLAVANSKHSPHLAPGGASAVGAVVRAAGSQAGSQAGRRSQGYNGEHSLTPVAAAFPNRTPLAFQGNPREQIYENQVPNKSPNKRRLSAAEKRAVITVNYFISSDL